MSKIANNKDPKRPVSKRRRFTGEFKEEAVQMLLDGHSAKSIAERLGISGPNLLYRWKSELVGEVGKTATRLDERVRDLESELRRVQLERGILKKALAIFMRKNKRRVYCHPLNHG